MKLSPWRPLLSGSELLLSGPPSPAHSLLWPTCLRLGFPFPPCNDSSDISSLDHSPRPDTSVQPLHPHLTLGANMPLRGLWSCCSPHPGGTHLPWLLSPDTWCNGAGPYGAFRGQTPSPMFSAVAPLWSTYRIVSDAYFPSCFTDTKTTTKWKKLTTWWSWTGSPRATGSSTQSFEEGKKRHPCALEWKEMEGRNGMEKLKLSIHRTQITPSYI